jgi:RNA polymerase sigma factor (sigma-70 family)
MLGIRGEVVSYEQFFSEVEAELRRYATALVYRHRVLRRLENPNDLLQAALVEMFRAWPRFTGSTPADFLAWGCGYLRKVASNLARMHGRAKRGGGKDAEIRRGGGDPWAVTAEDDSPLEIAIAKETCDRILAELKRLPPAQRALFRIVHLEARSITDAARVLGIAVPSAYQGLQRARAALRKVLQVRGS